MAFEFVDRLTDIFPLIIIQGNHDSNYNNSQRLDAITPICENLKHKKIVYLT
jgi:metallophosphoesterase superfamily enzyme